MKKRLFATFLTGVLALGLAGCKDKTPDNPGVDPSNKKYDNETTVLRFATQELDGVFNPFYSSSAPDSSVVGMTQIGMINNDKDGKPVCGENEPVVVLDYETIETGSLEDDTLRTTYNFVLKNNIKFSNGSPLTIKDVLFNLYVYLDPQYTGSSTIYSTDIVGLKEYRTQEESEDEQDSFMKQFTIEAETRVLDLVSAFQDIKDAHKESISEEQMKTYLKEIQDAATGDNRKHLVADYEKALVYIKEELEMDYNNSIGSYQDITFKNSNGDVHKNWFTTDVEAFLYSEGYITYDKKADELSSAFVSDVKELKTWTKEQAISTIYSDLIPGKLDEVVQWWSHTSTTLYQDLTNEAMENYFKQNESGRKYNSISGIQFANHKESVKVKDKTYAIPEYESDGSVKSGFNEVLSITIKGVDPKAIWNFSFSVAPMYYYSDQAHINAFDYEKNFGVEYGSSDFQKNVIKGDKIGVPVGAGAYQAANNDGSTTNVTAGEFKKNNVVTFVRNDHFLMGKPKIKTVRFQVIPQNNMLNALKNKEVDYVEPNAKPETIAELDGYKDQGISYKKITTNGYGYIGINSGKVPNIKVRQMIMHCINTQECIDYYKTTADPIHRPMSTISWAYPKGATPYYPYIGGKVPENLAVVNPDYATYVTKLGKKAGDVLTAQEQEDFVRGMIEEQGYTENASSGVYNKNNDKLQYTFTIAGNETDHPAYNALLHASELLNRWGFEVTVRTDANALNKLASGQLTVWAAAWSSTIDPDMYQVYHKDSKAGSTTNWGYKEILQNNGGKYDTELGIVEELSELIDQGRETNDQFERAQIYSDALDKVMQLAVELPTYQRKDLFVYDSNRIDSTSLTPEDDLTAYNGLTSKNWLISFN